MDKGQPHANLVNKTMIRLGEYEKVFAWKNATGCARAIQPPHQIVQYGLVGSSDIIAVVPRVITPDMVGQVIGQACFPEAKVPPDKQSEHQKKFERGVTALGARYFIFLNPDECVEKLGLPL